MRITATVDKAQAAAALKKAEGVRSVLVPAFVAALNRWLRETTKKIRDEKLTGQVLNVRTGTLRRSIIFTPAKESGGLITGQLQAGVGNKALVYARIHELGGTIPAHDIRPKNKLALRFANPRTGARYTKAGKLARRQVEGAVIFAKIVHMPAVYIPARPYMRPTAEENRPRLVNLIEQQIEKYAGN